MVRPKFIDPVVPDSNTKNVKQKKTVELHAACICMERSLPGIIMGITTSADALYYPIILLIVTYLARGTRYSRPYLLIIYLHIIGKLLIN